MALPPGLGPLRLPIIVAPMFIVSGPELVIAACSAGIVGTFPSLNARPKEALDEWIAEVGETLQARRREIPGSVVAPFGVNLIAHASNDRLDHDLTVCIARRVPLLITSLRAPTEIVPHVKAYGGLVFHDVTTVRHAEKAAEAGVDGLILVAAGAGGHAGTLNPFALLAEVRRFFTGTIVLAGAIGSGRAVLAARAMGADLAYMGTRFIATRESRAVDAYKATVVASAAKDIVYTPFFSGVPGSYLAAAIVRAGLDPAALVADKARSDYRADARDKAKAWRDIWSAGQGVGSIDDLPAVADLVDRLEREYRDGLAEICGNAPGPAA